MSKVQRSTDVLESIAEKAIYFFVGGAVLVAIGLIFLLFRGQGDFVPLGWVFTLFGALCFGSCIYAVSQVRKVTRFDVICPFCEVVNPLTETPSDDFPCVGCNRMIPIEDGKVLKVSQVRCGFCSALNFYSDKTEILLCEECDHEIPIAQDNEGKPKKSIPKAYQVSDDDALYELVLTAAGKNTEEVIVTLQQMLALNRNQVKDMLESLPVVLLTGINRRKAEMLQAQLTVHGASAGIQSLSI